MDTEAEFAASGETIPRSFVVKKGKVRFSYRFASSFGPFLEFLHSSCVSDVCPSQVDSSVACLVKDLREVMAPHTAAKLKERRDNSIKDYVNLAGTLKVTHLMMLTQVEANVNLKVGRMPNGPTLSFKVCDARRRCPLGWIPPDSVPQVISYSLMKNVRALQKRPLDAMVRNDCFASGG